MARARRCRNDLSSSTIRSDRSVGSELIAASIMIFPIPTQFRSYRVVDRRPLLVVAAKLMFGNQKSERRGVAEPLYKLSGYRIRRTPPSRSLVKRGRLCETASL